REGILNLGRAIAAWLSQTVGGASAAGDRRWRTAGNRFQCRRLARSGATAHRALCRWHGRAQQELLQRAAVSLRLRTRGGCDSGPLPQWSQEGSSFGGTGVTAGRAVADRDRRVREGAPCRVEG